MIKYMKILRHGKAGTQDTLTNGADIVIMEKLDGANASFKLEEGKVVAFSRNSQLEEGNGLRGFYEWTQNLDPNQLLEGVIYFGEWLVRHKLDYGENENKFYLFDVYDTKLEKYESFSIIEDESKRLGLNLCPVFYKGEF